MLTQAVLEHLMLQPNALNSEPRKQWASCRLFQDDIGIIQKNMETSIYGFKRWPRLYTGLCKDYTEIYVDS